MASVIERNKKLLEEEILSDVCFVVGETKERFKAHRIILSVASSVFYSMFNGNFTESKSGTKDVCIYDVDPLAFKALLDYIYMDKEPKIDENNWAPILYVSEKYDLPGLKDKCQSFVKANCGYDNASYFYSQARIQQVIPLVPHISNILAINADKSLSSNSILQIENNEILKEILSMDALDCDEIEVFRAALRWASAQIGEEVSGSQIREVLGPALYSIRFSLISLNDFMEEVVQKGILTKEESIAIFTKKIPGNESESIPFESHSRIRCFQRFNAPTDPSQLNVKNSGSLSGSSVNSISIAFNQILIQLNQCYTYKTLKYHSIKFKVNKSLKIYGIGIYRPINNGEKLNGKMNLKSFSDQVLLGESPIDIGFDKDNPVSIISLQEPIKIERDVWYVVTLDIDSNPIWTWMGLNGKTAVTVNGVKWTFDSDLSSQSTNVNQGQFPCFKFNV